MDWWKPWRWFRGPGGSVDHEEDGMSANEAEVPSTYPRFTYQVRWKYLPEPRRALKDSAIHFERQLTQSQIRDVVRALNARDPQIRCTGIKGVTGRPAAIALSSFGIQKQA